MGMLSLGDFSRMTYLSVKALRHYHDVGVLEPASIDPDTGYRFYLPSQFGLAQMIRRLRDLGMPLDEVRSIVTAPEGESRDATLVAHLRTTRNVTRFGAEWLPAASVAMSTAR